MKEIRAYVQPHVLPDLVQALLEIPGFPGMTVIDCEGFGQRRELPKQDYAPLVPKRRLEIIAADDLVEQIFNTILEYAQSGHPGDGKIYLFDVLEGARIRTGERSDDAI